MLVHCPVCAIFCRPVYLYGNFLAGESDVLRATPSGVMSLPGVISGRCTLLSRHRRSRTADRGCWGWTDMQTHPVEGRLCRTERIYGACLPACVAYGHTLELVCY